MLHDTVRRSMPAALLVAMALLAGCASTTPQRDGVSRPHEPEGALSSTGLANVQLAQNYLREGKYAMALERGQRAERSDPQSADVQIILGLIHERLNDRAAAGQNYVRAVRLAPDAGHVLNASGAWMCSEGKTVEADALFQRALQDPFYSTKDMAYFNAGKCALDAGQLDKSEVYLRQGLVLVPENKRLLELMAQLKFRQGDFMSARAFFQRRDSLGTPGPEMLELAARIEQAAGDAAAAARYRARLQQDHPTYTPQSAEGTPQ
jgi:type IV pilus assembly protein PilF